MRAEEGKRMATRTVEASPRSVMTARRLAWAAWGVTVAFLVAWPFVSEAATPAAQRDVLGYVVFPLAILGFATIGALITSRQPDNRIGLILAWIGFFGAAALAVGEYAKLSIDAGHSLPGASVAAWFNRASFGLVLAPLPLLFLLFPTGHVPTRRWRPVLWVLLAALVVNQVLFALTPGPLNSGLVELKHPVTNPLGLPAAWKGVVEALTGFAGLAVLVGAALSVVSLILRFRRAGPDERQQIRWLMYLGAGAVAIILALIASVLIRLALGIHVDEDNDPLGAVFFIAFALLIVLGIPAACGIAILRYRLYDLDVVIKKTVVFGALALFITAVYLLVVGLVGVFVTGTSSNTVSFAAGAAAALAFQPLRVLARRLADRVVYGKRATPYEVLTSFSGRMAETYSTEEVLPRMAEILSAGTGATSATVWLLVGGELRPVATSATSPNARSAAPIAITGDGGAFPAFPAGEHAFEVRHQGELLGALSLTMPASDPMNPTKQSLVRDVASQAGLVLRNVRLIEELRASRQRIVAAQDEERRKIERNLHDGAQQQLVSLAVQLRLAESMVGKNPEKEHELLTRLQSETSDALENLRDLARGIYPPLLAEMGLPPALQAQARKGVLPTTVQADGVGRYSQEIEAAVYFCCLEAMQNVAKYAVASTATVRLFVEDGDLWFEVADDGRGFDPSVTRFGTGLQGMADRLDAIGGTLRVESRPGEGTTVTGHIPAVAPSVPEVRQAPGIGVTLLETGKGVG
jgi:signal transduction histidine kinase